MVGDLYTADNLAKAFREPSLFLREGKRLLFSLRYGYRYGEGVDVMSEDWDNLIILDACRFDYFADVNNLEGNLTKAVSKGKSSWGFVNHNFVGRELHDTAAVTGNPFYERLDDDTFFTINSTLTDFIEGGGNTGVVASIDNLHPEKIKQEAIQTHQNHPNKRLIVHFMQPHQPFIGPLADELRERLEGTEVEPSPRKPEYISGEAIEKSLISSEEFREAYRENLEIVLGYVEELLAELDGKTIITADHGEALNERVLYTKVSGHKYELEIPQVRDVPWFTIDSENRRTVVADDPIGRNKLDDESLSRHLEALGYK